MLLTYGNRDTVAGVWSENFCKEHGIHVDFIQTIKMVDNYLPSFDMEEQMAINKHVDEQIQEAKARLEAQEKDIPQPTKESQEEMQDIGYNEKSETRILIEKFVEDNPEAAASLLRNWLNEEWE